MTILSKQQTGLVVVLGLGMLAVLGGCNKEDRDSISASVHASCGGALNLGGDHVFGYKETTGNYANYFFAGGFQGGDTKELGITMKWPPAPGTYSMGGLKDVGMYYDPTNASSGASQYGATGLSGTVVISNVLLASDNAVVSYDISFNNVEVINGAGDKLCISGSVKKN